MAPGALGRALTTLRPSGKAQFADYVLDVVTAGEFVAAEQPVAIVSKDGMRVVVKAVS
jgi:membrane-bound serine protease (ClpP class)